MRRNEKVKTLEKTLVMLLCYIFHFVHIFHNHETLSMREAPGEGRGAAQQEKKGGGWKGFKYPACLLARRAHQEDRISRASFFCSLRKFSCAFNMNQFGSVE